jgi:sulfate transport system permease protein
MARRHIIPGFRLTLGYTLFYLGLVVLIPLSALVLKTHSGGWEHFWQTVTDPRVVATYRVSFGLSLLAALLNGVFGVAAAWVLVRYRFPGRRLLDGIVDLPFALPTAVAGIAMAAIYAPNGPIGSIAQALGFKIAYTPLGITIAHFNCFA